MSLGLNLFVDLFSENNEQSKMVFSDDSKQSVDEAALVDMPELKNEEAHHLEGDRIVPDAESTEVRFSNFLFGSEFSKKFGIASL